MDFGYSPRTQELCENLSAFMDTQVAPSDAGWRKIAHTGAFPSEIVEPLKQRAREAGLWNLFLPSLRDDQPGTRLSNSEYAPLAEITGRVPWSPEVFNCNSPDSGNMEILQICASPEQRERWLNPLLDGSIRSCFSMTEPATASSDPTNLETTVVRDGNHYRVRGRKWFSTGAKHPLCRFSIVMGRSDLAGERDPHSRYSMVIVPFDTRGLTIVRDVSIMNHHSPEGHCEIDFDVRVPTENMLGDEGDGFAIAQQRLGPGRIHHCMRTIGQCELALELMIAGRRVAVLSARRLPTTPTSRIGSPNRVSRSTRPASSCCAPPGSWTSRGTRLREWTCRRSRSSRRACKRASLTERSRFSAPLGSPKTRRLPTFGHGAARCASSTGPMRSISAP
jgi:acyl-CoA dehydrogenase